MKKKEVKAWIGENLDRKVREFGVGEWKFAIAYDYIEPRGKGMTAMMEVTQAFDYQSCSIAINLEAFKDRHVSVLEECLEHELLHLNHGSFLMTSDLAERYMTPDQWEAFCMAYQRASEMTVRAMERTLAEVRRVAIKEGERRGMKLAIDVGAAKVEEPAPASLSAPQAPEGPESPPEREDGPIAPPTDPATSEPLNLGVVAR